MTLFALGDYAAGALVGGTTAASAQGSSCVVRRTCTWML